MSEKRSRFLAAIVGAQQSGKSYYASQLADTYTRINNGVIVYNWSGQNRDFATYYIGTFLTEAQISGLQNTVLQKLKYTDGDILYTVQTPEGTIVKEPNGKLKVYSLKFFNIDFFGKGLRFLEHESTDNFFDNVQKYVSKILLILDDAKSLVSHGLGEAGNRLTRRLNHCGSQHVSKSYLVAGIDCVFIFHSFDDIRQSIYSSLNYLVVLKTTNEPNFHEMGNPAAEAEVRTVYNELQTAEKYSHREILFSQPN